MLKEKGLNLKLFFKLLNFFRERVDFTSYHFSHIFIIFSLLRQNWSNKPIKNQLTRNKIKAEEKKGRDSKGPLLSCNCFSQSLNLLKTDTTYDWSQFKETEEKVASFWRQRMCKIPRQALTWTVPVFGTQKDSKLHLGQLVLPTSNSKILRLRKKKKKPINARSRRTYR